MFLNELLVNIKNKDVEHSHAEFEQLFEEPNVAIYKHGLQFLTPSCAVFQLNETVKPHCRETTASI